MQHSIFLHSWQWRVAQQHIQKALLCFQWNKCYTNAPQWHGTRSSPILFRLLAEQAVGQNDCQRWMVLVGERADFSIRVYGGWSKLRPSPVTHCTECCVGRWADLDGSGEEALSYPTNSSKTGPPNSQRVAALTKVCRSITAALRVLRQFLQHEMQLVVNSGLSTAIPNCNVVCKSDSEEWWQLKQLQCEFRFSLVRSFIHPSVVSRSVSRGLQVNFPVMKLLEHAVPKPQIVLKKIRNN